MFVQRSVTPATVPPVSPLLCQTCSASAMEDPTRLACCLVHHMLQVYKLDASSDAQPPTSPLGPGVMEDTYSDRLDIMACCKGDYSLHNRIMSGWVPGDERVTLSLADLSPATASDGSSGSPVVRRFVLWPYDRPESKGQLKGVSLRVEDGKVLVLGYRCVIHRLMGSGTCWLDIDVGWPCAAIGLLVKAAAASLPCSCRTIQCK